MEGVSQEQNISKPKKVKQNVAFKFSFRATQVPKGWEKLVVSMVSSLTGKASFKTPKALVKDGVCTWIETVIKSTKLTVGPHESSYEPKIYNFVVSKGSTHLDILGQAEMDVAALAMSNNEALFSLLLRNCIAGTVLHVIVQCTTPRPERRALDELSWPRQSECEIGVVPREEVVELVQSSVRSVVHTDETRMPSERTTESMNSIELMTQKKLVELLHSEIRSLVQKIASIEKRLREAGVQSAHDKTPILELQSIKGPEDTVTHFEFGKTDLKTEMLHATAEGSLRRSQMPMSDLRQQMNEHSAIEQKIEALRLENLEVQRQFLHAQAEVKLLRGQLRETQDETSIAAKASQTQIPYQVSLVMNIESKDEALERQLFEAQEEGRITNSQFQELQRQLNRKIVKLEQMEAKVQNLEDTGSRLEDQLYEERRQSSSHLDLLQTRVAGFDREMQEKIDELRMARAALESRLQEHQIDLDCTESLDDGVNKQVEDDYSPKHIHDAREFAVGNRWLNEFEQEKTSFLQTLSKLEKRVVSLLLEKANIAKQLSSYHVELDASKTRMVELTNECPQRVALVFNIEQRDEAIERQLLEAQEEGRLSKSKVHDLHRQLMVQIDRIKEMESTVQELEIVKGAMANELLHSFEEKRQSLSHLDLLQVRVAAYNRDINSKTEQLQKARDALESRLREANIDIDIGSITDGVISHVNAVVRENIVKSGCCDLANEFEAFECENGKFFQIIEKLEVQVVSLSRDKTELRRQLQHVEKENEELRGLPLQQVAVVMNVESWDEVIQRQLQEAQEEGRLTKVQLQELHNLLIVKLNSLQEMGLRVGELESARKKLEEQLMHSHEDRRQRLSHIDILQLRIATFDKEMESRVDNLQKASNSLEGRLRELQIELDLNNVLEDGHTTCIATDHEIVEGLTKCSLEFRLKVFEKESARSLKLISMLERQVVSGSRQRADLERQLECSHKMLASCNAELEELRSQPTQGVALIMNVESKDEAIERQLLKAQEAQLIAQVELIKDLKAKIEELEGIGNKLEDQLEQSHEERRQSMSHVDAIHIQLAAFDVEIESRIENLQIARASLESRMQVFQDDLPSQDVTDSSKFVHVSVPQYGVVDEDPRLGRDSNPTPSNIKRVQMKAFTTEIARFVQMHAILETQLLSLVDERDKYRAETKRSKEELADLRSQIDAHLSAKLRIETLALALGQSKEDLESQLKEFEDAHVQLSNTVSRLEQKLESLEVENAHYKLTVQMSEKRYSDLEAHIEELKKSKDQLEHELGEKIEGLLLALDEHQQRAAQVQDSINELCAEHTYAMENMKAEIMEQTKELSTSVVETEHRALQAKEEASQLRSEELVWKDKMLQMQELVRQAAVEATSIKAQFDARVQDLVAECHASKEQERELEFRLQEALKELDELKATGKCSRKGHIKQGCAAELFQAQLDISKVAIEQLIQTERMALEASLQRLQAGKQLLFDENVGTNLYQAIENVYGPSNCIGLNSHILKTRFGDSQSTYDCDGRSALTIHGKRKLKGRGQTKGDCIQYLQADRHAVSNPSRSQGSTATVSSSCGKHVQAWNRAMSSQLPSHEVIITPLRQHRECLYYLDELQYLWLRFRGLAES